MPALVLVLAALLVALAAPAAHASSSQESMFQDDDLLVYGSEDRVERTLDELRALGVDRIRVSLFWSVVAPAAGSQQRPDFDAAYPNAYPSGAWGRYERLLAEATERGLRVNFNITSPAPKWATGNPARRDIDDTYTPSAREFGLFVEAAGRRFPGVDYWSIWNEPNHPGWLTPQWRKVGRRWVEAAPRMYRELFAAAHRALVATGHGADTILLGETAGKGLRFRRGPTRAIDSLRFIRRLFCVDENFNVLRGATARANGCPARDQRRAFPARHPALFRATGWAHHPYELTFAPGRKPTWRDWATMSNLSTLSRTLRRVHDRYGQRRGRAFPLFLTEYGYQTRPPDRSGVSPRAHAAYINHAEYLAFRHPGVRSYAQFLMVDGGPPVDKTFQTGLKTRDGRRKPAYAAYRLPIHLYARRGRSVAVWGHVRTASRAARPPVRIEFRRRGGRTWRRLVTRRATRGHGYLETRVRVPGSGSVRLVAPGGVVSRAAPIRVR